VKRQDNKADEMIIHQRQAFCCPACGGFIGEAAPLDFVAKTIPGYQAQVLMVLRRHIGEPVAKDHLADIIYRGDPNGGPLYSNNTVPEHVKRLRKRLEVFGWTIAVQGRGQGVHATYRLIPLECGA
jgi:hypothetical protein